MGLRRGLVFAFLLLLPVLASANACAHNETGHGSLSNHDPDTGTIPLGPTALRSWTDLSYATVSNAEKLDLYLPDMTVSGPYPLIVYIHGGGWQAGDKTSPVSRGLVAQMLAGGYAVASINYRLSGDVPFPAAIQDAKAAVRWLRANASSYNLDTSHFGVWGDSAGAHIASLLGTSCDVTALEGAGLGNVGLSSCVQAVVDWFGPTDFLQMDVEADANGCPSNHDTSSSPESKFLDAPIQQVPGKANDANPITYASSFSPPFLIEHGTADCTVPYQQSQLLYDALQPLLGAKVSLTLHSGAVHEDPLFFTSSNVDLALDFLDQYLQ